MNWFEKMKSGFKSRVKREIPQGIWIKCKQCGHANYEMALERNHWICPECSWHSPIGHQQYVDLLIDDGTSTPTLVTDLLGLYTVSLVVTDEAGLQSIADEVIVSSVNVPPRALASKRRGTKRYSMMLVIGLTTSSALFLAKMESAK